MSTVGGVTPPYFEVDPDAGSPLSLAGGCDPLAEPPPAALPLAPELAPPAPPCADAAAETASPIVTSTAINHIVPGSYR